MPTILIGGYYGAGNIGDESILAAMIGELRGQRSDISFIVTSWNPEKTRADLKVAAFYYNDINALLEAALSADLIILGGGGIFHDYWGLDPDTYLRRGYWDLTFFGSMPLLAKLLNIPCMIYAVGVGPFQSDLARQHTRLAFERCQIATVRDGESLEALKQTGFDVDNPRGPVVKILPDPVFSLTTTPADDAEVDSFLEHLEISADTQLLGISLRYWDLECPLEEWLPYVANGVREFLNLNSQAQVILIPYQVTQATAHTNDALVLKKLADLMDMPDRVHWINQPLHPHFVQALIKRCTAIVGMRLHSVIMGINVGTPVVALSYAPKVWSVMKLVGLEKFCNATLTPKAGDLAAQIKDVWNQKDEFRLKIKPIQKELREETKKHAGFALDLLSHSHRSELQFSQQFALQQVRLLLQADEKLAHLQEEKHIGKQSVQAISAQISKKEQSLQAKLVEKELLLNEIVNSKSWKVALLFRQMRTLLVPPNSRRARILRRGVNIIIFPFKKIRRNQKIKADLALIKSSGLFDETWYLIKNPDVAQAKKSPLHHYLQNGGFEGRDPSVQFCSTWYSNTYEDVKKAGINPLIHYLRYGRSEGRLILPMPQALSLQVVEQDESKGIPSSYKIVRNLAGILNDRLLNGIIVITSMFTFNELYNQWDIDLCKALSAQGWGFVFVAGRWDEKETRLSIGDEVFKNVFQISKDAFLENLDAFSQIQNPRKYFMIEFPHPDFFLSALTLRHYGFKIVYEIIDEWEEFHKAGQASWFNKSIENALVINANFLTAVSGPLIEKFSSFRQDIHLSPNVPNSILLGEKNRNVARQDDGFEQLEIRQEIHSAEEEQIPVKSSWELRVAELLEVLESEKGMLL